MFRCCLSSAKIQNFKAIHNFPNNVIKIFYVVYPLQKYKISKQFTTPLVDPYLGSVLFILCKNTKFQSNSQHGCPFFLVTTSCLSSAKIQNFKAIHNRVEFSVKGNRVVYPLQKYKISKQFTTFPLDNLFNFCCLSSAKIQNFKAIHNYFSVVHRWSVLFILCKNTKFQSNSQRSN